MSETSSDSMRRRDFLQGGAALAAALPQAAGAAQAEGKKAAADARAAVLPRRVLGKTGVEVTILNEGTWRAPGSLDRLLRHAYSRGVRYFDTARAYNTEDRFRAWFAAAPEVRKNIFLATKDGVRAPGDMVKQVDRRLEALGTDYIDLLFFHGLGSRQVNWPKSREMKQAVEAIKKTGKVRFVGFSTHDARRAEQLHAAAQGGFIDVIMLQFTPWLEEDEPLNRALDACHEANVGLVSMKQMAGHVLKQVPGRVPVLKERGLSPHQGLLTAIWSDERISTACVAMTNTDQINQNTDAARRFRPLEKAEVLQIRDAVLAAGPMMCADCDGRCARAAGTTARLGDMTRFLTYHEHHGLRVQARENYAELSPEERDWSGADLAAAREACPNKLNFTKLLPNVDRLLG
jgi:predicted aldo/keto reductase-like oxidoreductase